MQEKMLLFDVEIRLQEFYNNTRFDTRMSAVVIQTQNLELLEQTNTY